MLAGKRIILILVAPLILAGIGPLAQGGGKGKKKANGKTPVVQHLKIKGLPKGGKFTPRKAIFKPKVINNQEELKKFFKNESVVKKIQKHVNFRAQKVLYFRWSGSGQDRLQASVKKTKKGQTILFQYTPGLTRDLRHHAKLYAVRRGTEWKVVRKGRR